MKGIIFAGCSFTWGQGLYFYSDLPRLIKPVDGRWDSNWVTNAQLRYKDTIRYPRIVANRLDTFEIVKESNGGSDIGSLDFISNLFESGKYEHDEISHIVFQLTDAIRSDFSYDILLKRIKTKVNEKDFYNVLYNNLDIDNLKKEDILDLYSLMVLEMVESELRKYESLGIKTYLLTWFNTPVKHIKNNEWLNKRFIKFNYLGEEFNSIDDLQYGGRRLMIKTDSDEIGEEILDDHPSKLCHKIIADSVLKKMKNENI
jgi:hypothetical protein